MTPYDMAMIGVVIAGMIWGAMRGITWQVASIASLVLGYAVAFPLSAQLAPHFPGEPIVARALALLAAYAAVSGGIYLAAWSIRAVLRQWRFEAYDRHLGMILGGLEGALLGIVATLFVLSLAPQARRPILASRSGHVVGQLLSAAEPVLPGEVRAELGRFWSGDEAAVATSTNPDDVPPASDDSAKSPAASDATGSATVSKLEGLIQDEAARARRVAAEAIEKGIEGVSSGEDATVKRR